MIYSIDSDQSYQDLLDAIAAGELTKPYFQGDQLIFQECEFEFNPKYLQLYKTHCLIYGKNHTTNIVNISYKNNNVHIFTEIQGKVLEDIVPYRHWVLSSSGNQFTRRLKGDNHYKYIRFYTNESEYLSNKPAIYKYNLYNIKNVPEAFMTLNGYTYFKGMKLNQVSMLSFDIETSGLNPQAPNANVFLITNYYRDCQGRTISKTFNVDDYQNDTQMIFDWCEWVREINPSLLVAHNGVIFDLPYLHERSKGGLRLGRDGSLLEFENFVRQKRKDGSQSYSYKRITVFGREVIDTFFLMLTADSQRKFESYALKSLIKEIGQEKTDRTYIDAGKISEYWNDPVMKLKVIQYAEEDAEDSVKLLDTFAAPYFYFTQHIPKSFQMMMESATGSQLNMFLVRAYLQDDKSIPQADDISEEKVEGGISFGVPGIYRNLSKIDIKSAYPSQILRLKLYNKRKDPEANFYNMVHYFANKRFEYKKLAKETGDKHWIDLDAVNKIVINSAYGVTNTSGLNFNDAEIAKTITKETREVIDLALRWASGNNYRYWIDKFYSKMKVKEDKQKYLSLDGKYKAIIQHDFIIGPSDTDSISFCKSDMSPFSKEEIKQLTKEINDLSPDMIEWEDDGYYDACLALKAKNYVLKTEDKYTKKGSALKSSKLEPALKQLLDDLIKDSLEHSGKNLRDIYHQYIKEAMNPIDISRWCQKKTVTKPILSCKDNPEARKNESTIWDAIANKRKQEGDKIYLYPVIKETIKEEKINAKGKVSIKNIEITGLRCLEDYNNDANTEKLIQRVYDTTSVMDDVLDENPFIDYTLVKNKHLLDNL